LTEEILLTYNCYTKTIILKIFLIYPNKYALYNTNIIYSDVVPTYKTFDANLASHTRCYE